MQRNEASLYHDVWAIYPRIRTRASEFAAQQSFAQAHVDPSVFRTRMLMDMSTHLSLKRKAVDKSALVALLFVHLRVTRATILLSVNLELNLGQRRVSTSQQRLMLH